MGPTNTRITTSTSTSTTNTNTSMVKHPAQALLALFVLWKLLLVVLALASPGPGYDTSTQLLLQRTSAAVINHETGRGGMGTYDDLPFRDAATAAIAAQAVTSTSLSKQLPVSYPVHRLVQKLTRWDAIYFASIAGRGYYRVEQEWAFGWGFTRLLSFLASYFPITHSRFHDVSLHGIIIANVSHLLSVLLVYRIACALPLCSKERKHVFALIAAALYVVSPAGIVLVAPFTEAPFALLNVAGHLCYILSWGDTESSVQAYGAVHDLYILLAGACFGVSATVRGNGILSGILFFYDAVVWLGLQIETHLHIRLVSIPFLPAEVQSEVKSLRTRRMPATILAGLLTAIGFATPQVVAYPEYCRTDTPRPWCSNVVPSIFTFVQAHYWNNGFLRYWTLSNLPLFLVAAPVLYTMCRTSYLAALGRLNYPHQAKQIKKSKQSSSAVSRSEWRRDAIYIRIGLVQLALSTLALTSFHVQIINRISSGYPLWYLLMARDIMNGEWSVGWICRWMVGYAIVQTILFASFLPPA